MSELQLPWIEAAIMASALGAAWVARIADPARRRWVSLAFAVATLVFTLGAYLDFLHLNEFEAHDRWDLLELATGMDLLVMDELSAPLLPLTALLFALTILATLRTALPRFSFGTALTMEAIVLATLASKTTWLVTALLALGTLPPWIEQRRKGRSTRLYALHMGTFVALLAVGQVLAHIGGAGTPWATVAALLSAAGLLVRCGVAPFHCWVVDLIERGSFGTAILVATPMVGVYGLMRLTFPVAPSWMLSGVAGLSLATAVYAAAMTLVQPEPRRFFGYLFVGHGALVLVGIDIATPVGLTGALALWISVCLSLTGLGLTLRCVEARVGKLSLQKYHGLYERAPVIATFFLLTGLASIGFPGTIGFVGAELLFEGAMDSSLFGGSLLVLAAALNGLAVLHAYGRIFTGREPAGTIDLRIRPAERAAVLILTLLILGGGIYPQPGVSSRYHAATELLKARGSGAGERVSVQQRTLPSRAVSGNGTRQFER